MVIKNYDVCPICNSRNISSKNTTNLCLVTICGACGHEYTQKKDIFIKENYNKEYFDKVHKNWFANPQINLFELIIKIIKKRFQKENLRILDVGCGRGALLLYMRKNFRKAFLCGIDLSEPPIDMDSSVRITQSSIDQFKSKNLYDVVLSTAVIEHIFDVKGFLKKFNDLVEENGIVIIVTNDTGTPLYKVARILYFIGIKSPYERLYNPHHVNHFSKRNLEILAKKSGFKAILKTGINVPLSSLDIPASNKIQKFVYKISVYFLFVLGSILRNCFLQIYVFKKF